MKPNRREFLASSAAFGVTAAQPTRRPNILLISDDQHNANKLGCYGDPVVKTPNLDRLAGRGTRFMQAYSNNMVCAPSRLSMVTGQYVHSHGYYANSGPHPGQPVWVTSYLRVPALLRAYRAADSRHNDEARRWWWRRDGSRPTRDIWWNNMDWETVKKKYHL